MQEHFVPRAIDVHQLGQHLQRSANINYAFTWSVLHEAAPHLQHFELQHQRFDEEIDF